jgi:hypothetical protein
VEECLLSKFKPQSCQKKIFSDNSVMKPKISSRKRFGKFRIFGN